MKVILRENVENLGQIGDVKNVSAGYARNFLLPRKLVVLADEANIKEMEHHRRTLEKKRAAARAGAEAIASKLSEQSLTFTRKVGKGDKLFGSVSASDIVAELVKAGFKVNKSMVQLDDTIKTLGVHPIAVKIQPEVVATVKVWVAKDEKASAAGE
ncbi:MAG TPA: 50S ribosomal protein L9 [Bdellovibrionota bacterium]|nr:50S ribosomal protein L9 [Bdellovibrionota bacterium]